MLEENEMGHNHHNTSSDGVSHRVNSPRFSGPMTRRAHSFKRTTNNEIELQINSPRSEIGTNSLPSDPLEPVPERKHVIHRVHVKKPIESIVVGLGLREKKKLGHWMFLVFCGACLFLGVLKICATGWLGSAIETAQSNQVCHVSTMFTPYPLTEISFRWSLLILCFIKVFRKTHVNISFCLGNISVEKVCINSVNYFHLIFDIYYLFFLVGFCVFYL